MLKKSDLHSRVYETFEEYDLHGENELQKATISLHNKGQLSIWLLIIQLNNYNSLQMMTFSTAQIQID